MNAFVTVFYDWSLAVARLFSWAAPLAVRITVGVVFMGTGWTKLTHLPQITKNFTAMGIPAPEIHYKVSENSRRLLDFHIDFLNKIPILWTVFVFIVVIGAIYYLVVGRRKEFAPVIAPAGDDAPLVSATPPGPAAPPEE